MDFHHDTHTHPFIPDTTGIMGGSFQIPTTGETSANVWYRIQLTVKDSRGLEHTSFRDILPRTAQVTIVTNPSGLQITLDGQPQTTPITFTGVVGITRTLGAVSPQPVNGTPWEFQSWSMGGTAIQDVPTPSLNTTFIATYRVACPPDVTNQVDLSSLGTQRVGTSNYYILWLTLRNKTASTIPGPLALVVGNLQNALMVGPSVTTSCGPGASNPGVSVPASDNQLSPGEVALAPVLILKVGTLPVSAVPSVLSGIPLR